MNTHMPTPDELLHAWIDEEIDPRHEPQFFALLATDAELRDLLRQLRAIRYEARYFGAAAEPPAATTSALFSRLGFEETENDERKRAVVLPLLSRAWTPVAAAASAAAITAMLFLGLQQPASTESVPYADAVKPAPAATTVSRESTQEPNANNQRISGNYSTLESLPGPISDKNPEFVTSSDDPARTDGLTDRHANPANMAAPAAQQLAAMDERGSASVEDAAAEASWQGDLRETAREAQVVLAENTAGELPVGNALESMENQSVVAVDFRSGERPSSFVDPSVTDELGSATIAAVERSFGANATLGYPADAGMNASRAMPAAAGAAPASMQGERVQPVDTRQFFPDLREQSLLRFVSVELRGMQLSSFPEPTINTGGSPLLENMAIAVFYGMDRHDVGVEFGQEPFSMHYDGVEAGKVVKYQQNLLTPWLLASWRYRFAPIRFLGGIEPYVTASAGASLQLWPTARAGAGLMYMPDSRVRFHVGVEGSVLAFPYQDEWFSSRRAGFTYGLSVLL